MRPIEQDEPEPGVGPVVLYDANANGQLEAPPFCSQHATSAQRKKLPEAQMRECSECNLAMSTNYETFAVCPPCARKVKRCVVCGDSTEPGAPLAPPLSPPRSPARTSPPRTWGSPPKNVAEEQEEEEEDDEDEDDDDEEDEEEGHEEEEDEEEEEDDYDDEDDE